MTKNTLIFLIIHDENRRDNYFSTSQDKKIIKIRLSRYKNLLEETKGYLKKTILELFLKHIGDFKAYESNIPARLDSL